jgi:hypothetical protein
MEWIVDENAGAPVVVASDERVGAVNDLVPAAADVPAAAVVSVDLVVPGAAGAVAGSDGPDDTPGVGGRSPVVAPAGGDAGRSEDGDGAPAPATEAGRPV